MDGDTWSNSPRARFGLVSTFGSPPPAETLSNPVATSLVAKMMVLFVPHVAPRGFDVNFVIGNCGPPAIGTFRMSKVCGEKYPIHRPSGDRNGYFSPQTFDIRK